MARKTLTSDIRSLAKLPGTLRQRELKQIGSDFLFEGKVGVGKVSAGKGSGSAVTTDWLNVFTVYSEILIQKEGAYEKPPGWPSTNTYSGFSVNTEDLPILNAPYLIDRREHVVLYRMEGDILQIFRPLSKYLKPFVSHGEIITPPLVVGKFVPVWKSETTVQVTDGNDAMLAAIAEIKLVYGLT